MFRIYDIYTINNITFVVFDLYITHFISEIINTTGMTHLKSFNCMLCVHSVLTVCCVYIQY